MQSDSLESIPDIWQSTYDIISQVPKGRITTYGAVARALGDIIASRFVGLAVSQNENRCRVPFHRVISSNGQIGGHSRNSSERKSALLEVEGIDVSSGKVHDLESVLFDEFETTYPLQELKQRQRVLRRKVAIPSRDIGVDHIAGIDVAYSGDQAFVSLVIFDAGTGDEVERRVLENNVGFPYIPSYLAFRELPLIMPLSNSLNERTVLIYDGNGTLHPERFGIACHAGVELGIPTIGVAKKLLCGTPCGRSFKNAREVRLNDEVVGYEYSTSGSGRPIYVSAGNGISQKQALTIVGRMTGHRIPEPTRLAHIAAGNARRAKTHK